MRTLAIVNPAGGGGVAGRVWRRVSRQVEATRGWECATTLRPGHAVELARSAAASGFERLVVFGGDGTVGEVANGLAGTMVALAIIPCGTGNDCARNLGVPLGPISAARLAADGRARSIDLGLIDSAGRRTYFVNVAGVGFDAEVAWRVSRVPRLVGGTRLYVAGVVRALVGWRSPQIRLVIDGEVVDQRVFLAAIANGPSYGGGMRIAPTARFDDGVLDLCIVGEIGRAEVLRLVPRMYSGGHVGHPAVRMMRGVEVSVESGMRVRCHADGEVLGGLPARLTVVPRALSCVLPP